MLSEKQLMEIREHLEKAQNPLFFYDNDADGLCSYVILRKFIGRGKGVAVKSFPDLNASYAKKAQELNADYVFVLDKPVVSREFVEELDKMGLTMVWIDHHEIQSDISEKEFKHLFIYNPALNHGKDKSFEPVTYWSYKVSERKEDLWLAVVGCIYDHYLPEFVAEFKKEYPDFWGKVKDPFDAYFGTEIGRIARAFNFGLKDSVSNVVRLQNFLIACKNPGDVFAEEPTNYLFRKRYGDVKKKYDILIDGAKTFVKDKLIFFEYSGDLSISSDLSNELLYRNPGKYVAVAYKNGNITNISLRGKNVKKILEKILKDVSGTGGGHEDAVGARIKADDLGKFKELLEKEI